MKFVIIQERDRCLLDLLLVQSFSYCVLLGLQKERRCCRSRFVQSCSEESMSNVYEEWKAFENLTLTNNFMFGEVVADEETGKNLLEIILNREIARITVCQKEKALNNIPGRRGIRFDVYLKDELEKVYNLEMQIIDKHDLPKRSRYYQGMLDTQLLPSGAKNYNILNQTIIIFICMFDPFGFEKCKYTFESCCREVPELKLQDGSTRIFLNVRGKNQEEITTALAELLKYLADPEHTELHDNRMIALDNRLHKIKRDKETRDLYMTFQEIIEDVKDMAGENGRAEGLAEGKVSTVHSLRKMKEKQVSVEEAVELLDLDREEIASVYELVEEYPDESDLEIARRYVERLAKDRSETQ